MEELRIEALIDEIVRILSFQCDFLELLPSEFIKVLNRVTEQTKENLMSDEQYMKRKTKEIEIC